MATKTRFVIQAEGQLSELFSVRERTNGDLVVLGKKSNQIGSGIADKYWAVEELRMSIHVSPNSPGTTIVQHVRLANSYSRIYAFVTPRDRQLTWLLFAALCQDLSAAHYETQSRQSDATVSLGAYRPRFSALIYFVVLTSAGGIISPPHGFNVITSKFRVFDLHVIWAYLPAPSIHQGEYFISATSLTLESDDLKHERRLQVKGEGHSRGELRSLIKDVVNQMVRMHTFKLQRLFASEGATLPPGALEVMTHVLRDPVLPTSD